MEFSVSRKASQLGQGLPTSASFSRCRAFITSSRNALVACKRGRGGAGVALCSTSLQTSLLREIHLRSNASLDMWGCALYHCWIKCLRSRRSP